MERVGNPDPEPDPQVFGPPGPDQLVRGRDPAPDPSLLSGPKFCLQNKILTHNFSKKLNF
jgi:hypothetical protein